MTTYQEPPLQSRREAREAERARIAAAGAQPEATAADPAVEAPPAPEESRVPSYDGPDFHAQPTPEITDAAQPPQAPPAASVPVQPMYRVRDYTPESRRSAPSWAPVAPPAEGTGLDYQTQQRPVVTGETQLPVVEATPVDEAPVAQAQVAPIVEASWSPESAAAVEAAALSPWAPHPPAPVEFATESDESAAAPAAFPTHTMTRRELRALREAEGITSVDAGHAAPTPAELAAAAAALGMDVAEPSAPTVDGAIPELVEPAPFQPSTGTSLSPFDALFLPPSQRDALAEEDAPPAPEPDPFPEPVAEEPAASEPVADTFGLMWTEIPAPGSEPTPVDPKVDVLAALVAAGTAAPEPESEPEPELQLEVTHIPAPVVLPVVAPIVIPDPSTSQVEVPTTTGERPIGHWSTQADLDDATQTGGGASSNFGASPVTASALVLPAMPNHDISGAISTGDILVTGSIDLPRSLAATGAHPTQLDEADLDHLLDPGDQQVTSADSQPVRAIRAVSTHTSSRGVINAAKPRRSNRMLTILIIAACGMGVVVATLLIVALTTGVLR